MDCQSFGILLQSSIYQILLTWIKWDSISKSYFLSGDIGLVFPERKQICEYYIRCLLALCLLNVFYKIFWQQNDFYWILQNLFLLSKHNRLFRTRWYDQITIQKLSYGENISESNAAIILPGSKRIGSFIKVLIWVMTLFFYSLFILVNK